LIEEIAALRKTLRILRGENGCPWDREQTIDDMIFYMIDESYELLQAANENELEKMEEELGDVFFIIIFIHELILEMGGAPLDRIVARIHEKLIHRHPHVFGDSSAETSTQSLEEWNRIKNNERSSEENGTKERNLDSLPTVRKALTIQKEAATVGFDWPEASSVMEKLHEEMEELENELGGAGEKIDRGKVKDELGDLFFTIINLSRKLSIDPENALDISTRKFIKRFALMEKKAEKNGKKLSSMSLEEMEHLWERAKSRRPDQMENGSGKD